MTANTYGRQVVVPLTNKSGGGVIAGDVVIVDTGNNDAFTTTTSASSTVTIGVAQETIANNATGRVLISGYAALVNTNASVTRGHYGATYTVAKQATDAGASRVAGTFCQFLTGGTTPDAMVYPVDLAGTALTNPMTTAGDIIYGGSSGTPTRLAGGTSGYVLTSTGTTSAPAWQAAAGSGHTVLLDTFNRADGAVGHASGGGGQLWNPLSGTWAISSNTLIETGGGSERFIFIHTGPATGKRTITWVLNTKPSSGDGGFVFRAIPVASSNTPNAALLLNIEATYKLYNILSGASYTAVTINSGSAATPANGDSIVITDDGYEVTVTVNGGSPWTYLTSNTYTSSPFNGPFVGFRSASSTTIKHDSITIVDL